MLNVVAVGKVTYAKKKRKNKEKENVGIRYQSFILAVDL